MNEQLRNIIVQNDCWAGAGGNVVNVYLNKQTKSGLNIRCGIFIAELGRLFINNKCPKSLKESCKDIISRI